MTGGQAENPFAGQGSVLLDIGGDVGALVVTMPTEMVDMEVEIRPAGAALHAVDHVHEDGSEPGHDHGHDHDHPGGHHPHVAVVERPVGGTVVPSLVFPDLVEGRYELLIKETEVVRLTAQVNGGEVTTEVWPTD